MHYNLIKLILNCVHIELNKPKSRYEQKNVLDVIERLIRSILSGKIYFPKWGKRSHLFFFATKNQFVALANIRTRVFGKSLTYYHGNDISIDDNRSVKYPFWLVYFLSLLAYVIHYRFILKIERRLKKINPKLGYRYLIPLYLGHYFFDVLLLRIHKPKYLWMSNDHTYLNVAFLYAAKKVRVKSVYIQHASVSPLFPPLNFDYAFLDGEVAYQTYKEIGIRGTNVSLSGISKMDGYIGKYDSGKKISNILICMNQLDNTPLFEELINQLIKMKYTVKIRKHPYMTAVLNNEGEMNISKEKALIDSLSDVDLLIAGDSNVHLEATLANIPCFYLSTSKYFDYYGFLRNDLVVWGGKDTEECLKQVQSYIPEEDIYLRAKPYCASLGTEFENESTTFILNKLGIDDH